MRSLSNSNIFPRPRRDRDVAKVRLEAVSRPRRRGRDYIPGWYPVLSNFTRQFYTIRTWIHWRFSVPKFFNIGPDLLEIFENIPGVRFFETHCINELYLNPAPAVFLFLNPARSGCGLIWNSQPSAASRTMRWGWLTANRRLDRDRKCEINAIFLVYF